MAEIYATVSGKGGVGKSTFVAGVSKGLADLGKRVLAVDCDIGLRSLDLLFGCSDKVVFDWGDLICGRCEKDNVIIRGETDYIAAPRSYEDEYTPEAFGKVIKDLSAGYDYVFLDSPAGIGAGFRITLGCARKAVAVSTPDNICIRSCSRAREELEKAGIEDTRLVINMFDKKSVVRNRLLNVDDCIDGTGIQLLGIVPIDRTLAYASVTGVAPDEFAPSEQAFFRIAKRITGERVPLVFE
ncbi:MAG: P-loop NTPase [Clostridia bacterium]|nr:P-loop NTPase [Clostridia bacterium]